MRRLILSISISLDGFIEGPNRDIGWHKVDAELHEYFNAEMRRIGAFLSGRITHELMASVWPTAATNPDFPPVMREFGPIWCDKPKYVFSKTLTHADFNTTIVREVVPDEIRALKAQPGGDMTVGGADLAATFRRLGLIDEYRIYVHPVVIGRGKPLFEPGDVKTELRLTETRRFGNGVVLLRYDVL